MRFTRYAIAVAGLAVLSCEKKTETPVQNPPVAILSVNPSQGDTSTVFTLDGSGSYQTKSLKSGLQYRWDWDSDGYYDTDWRSESSIMIRYLVTGSFTITMEVINGDNLTDTDTRSVLIVESSGGGKPVVSTQMVSGITQTSANVSANVSSDGGYAVTARGICWSSSPSPTLANNVTTNGTGTGSFTGSLTGLSPGTPYYARAYATNSIGTSYGNELTFTTESSAALQIGDEYGGGIIAYILQPGDPGYVAGSVHGLIAASSDQSDGAPWGCYGTLIGVTSLDIGSGFNNTGAIVGGCPNPGTAAIICYTLEMNGYNDWYLPSRDELVKLYQNRNSIGGFSPYPYWSSSEAEFNYSWFVNFYNGHSTNTSKDANQRVRAVRSF